MSAVPAGRKRGARAEVPITKDAIVETAFRIIEERGLEAFSMRSLATELGVFPATLYWHVGDRSCLLGLVEHRWIEEVVLPDECTDWRDWMLQLGRRYRAHALAHPPKVESNTQTHNRTHAQKFSPASRARFAVNASIPQPVSFRITGTVIFFFRSEIFSKRFAKFRSPSN